MITSTFIDTGAPPMARGRGPVAPRVRLVSPVRFVPSFGAAHGLPAGDRQGA